MNLKVDTVLYDSLDPTVQAYILFDASEKKVTFTDDTPLKNYDLALVCNDAVHPTPLSPEPSAIIAVIDDNTPESTDPIGEVLVFFKFDATNKFTFTFPLTVFTDVETNPLTITIVDAVTLEPFDEAVLKYDTPTTTATDYVIKMVFVFGSGPIEAKVKATDESDLYVYSAVSFK